MADGGEEVTRLVYEFDARFDRLEAKLAGINRSVHGSAKEIEKSFSAINIDEALDKVFDSSRLAVLDAGAERLRVFGSALEPLGVLGIAAGAGLAAFGAGLELAEKTGEWATELGHLSEKLGLTAEQVQKLDYVWTASGVGIEKGREAIAALNEELGKGQAGLLRPQSAKAFEALGFGKDPAEIQKQLLQFHDVGDLLDALPVKFETAGSAAERSAIGKRLGIESLIPILHEGAGGLADLTKQVSGYGIMSDEAVAHAAKLNEQLETAKARIHEAALALGAEMQPALIGLNNWVLNLINNFKLLWTAMAGSTDPTAKMRKDVDDAARYQMAGAQAKSGAMRFSSQGDRSSFIADMAAKAKAALDDANKAADQIKAEEAQQKAEAEANKPKALVAAAPPKKPKATPGETFDALDKDTRDKTDEAAKGYAQAMAALTEDVVARGQFEKQEIADELAKKTEDLKAAQDKVDSDRKLSGSQKKQLTQQLQLAQLGDELTAIAKAELVDRKTQQALREQARALSDAGTTSQADMVRSQQPLAKSSQQRLTLALELFDLEEQLLKSKLEEVVASSETTENQKKIAALQLQSLDATAPSRRQEITQQNAGPLQKYSQGLSDSTGPGLGDTLQTIAVKGLETLNTDLSKAIVNAKNFGQAFGSALREIESSLVNLALEKYLTLPLAQALGLVGGTGGLGGLFGVGTGTGNASNAGSLVNDSFGFAASSLVALATGTDFAPGGLALVGEQGPELVNLQKGAQVVPNNMLGNVSVTGGMSAAAPSISFDLRGAVMTADLLDQMNQISAASEQRATQNGAAIGLQAARTLIPTEMARRSSLQIR